MDNFLEWRKIIKITKLLNDTDSLMGNHEAKLKIMCGGKKS